MSVTLIPGLATSLPGTTAEQATAAAVAATRTTTFLRGQAQWLQRGLLNSSDRVVVDLVLSAHDRSHERWVVLIGQIGDTLGEQAAADVASVYAYFGRVAGSLDAGTMETLCPNVAAQARHLLAERLTDLTETAVESVWRMAAEL